MADRPPMHDEDEELDEHELHALGLLDTLPLFRAADSVPPKDEQH